ncbi:MAG: hypothetical protein WCO26_04170 [Deltaproteobacteria bacterium]
MDIPNPDNIENVSDWVELKVSCNKSKLSKAQLARYIEEASGSEPEESFINNVWNELARRESAYNNPPFKVESKIVYSLIEWQIIPAYMTCLIFSVYGGYYGLSASAKLFERITSQTIERYGGFKTKIFGWPVEAGDPKDIKTRAEVLARDMNERFIEPPDAAKKDDTLDIAAWKPFHDKKSSQIVLLVQCATGGHWEQKSRELRMRAWEQYIHWGCPPLAGFAIPHIVGEKKWLDLTRDAGLIMDRVRIYNILIETAEDEPLRSELRKWCQKQIAKLDN